MARKDFRQRLTDALVEAIEENDGLPWQRGWDSMALRPFNPARGIKYKGGNVVNLLMEQIKRDSDDPRWMTLKQANEAGYSIRKGAKAAYVEYWDWGQQSVTKPEVDDQGKPLERDETVTKELEAATRRPRVFYAAVFNGEDVVGLPELNRAISWQPNDLAEALIAASGAEIKHAAVSRHGGTLVEDAAYYSHQYDKIVLPLRESFKSDSDYYATALHELAHWTGHHTRLERRAPDEKRPFGSPEYAREELRAEIASAYLTAMLGIEGDLHNHAKYTGHWLEVLKGDKHEIFRAARDAEEIVDHLFELAPELREIVEARMADNVLPKEPARRKIGTGIIGELPNFIPADAEPVPARTGKDDPRWSAFERTITDEAARFGVEREAVSGALALIAPQFTEIMDRAKANGFSADEMNSMLGRSIVDEMRQADARQQSWEGFCEQVRELGKAAHPVERIELALQQLGGRYQQTVVQSARESWPQGRTDAALRSVLEAAAGGLPVTPEGVTRLVSAFAAPAADDDLVLKPLGLGASAVDDHDDDLVLQPFGVSGEMPDDAGATRDEPILMHDAEITESNSPS